MEKLNRAQKCSILGPQNLGSRGAWAPGALPESTPAVASMITISMQNDRIYVTRIIVFT